MKKQKSKNLVDIQDMVYSLLSDDPRTRDDDNLLCVIIWSRLFKKMGFDVRQEKAYDFLLAYLNNKLVAADTITRARRKLQEENILLRGNKYQERQRKQAEVRSQLGNL
jgi:hypothetical protein